MDIVIALAVLVPLGAVVVMLLNRNHRNTGDEAQSLHLRSDLGDPDVLQDSAAVWQALTQRPLRAPVAPAPRQRWVRRA